MVVSHHLYRIGESGLGVLIAVHQLVLEQAHQGLERLFVPTRCREIEIGQLQHRLQIFDGRRSIDALRILCYLGRHRNGFPGERFLQLGGIESTDTGHLNHVLGHLCRRQVRGLDLTVTAFGEGLHQDLVRFEFRRVEDDLDSVGQHPFGRLDLFVITHGFDLAFMRRFLDQFAIEGFLYRCLNGQVTQAG